MHKVSETQQGFGILNMNFGLTWSLCQSKPQQ